MIHLQNNGKGGYNVAEKDQKEKNNYQETDWFNMVREILKYY